MMAMRVPPTFALYRFAGENQAFPNPNEQAGRKSVARANKFSLGQACRREHCQSFVTCPTKVGLPQPKPPT
jgi:hypothetical protein